MRICRGHGRRRRLVVVAEKDAIIFASHSAVYLAALLLRRFSADAAASAAASRRRHSAPPLPPHRQKTLFSFLPPPRIKVEPALKNGTGKMMRKHGYQTFVVRLRRISWRFGVGVMVIYCWRVFYTRCLFALFTFSLRKLQ